MVIYLLKNERLKDVILNLFFGILRGLFECSSIKHPFYEQISNNTRTKVEESEIFYLL